MMLRIHAAGKRKGGKI